MALFLLLRHLADSGDFLLFAYFKMQSVLCQAILVDTTAVKTPCQIKPEFGTVILQIHAAFYRYP